MKKMVSLYILVLPLIVCAQNDFEGIITYTGTNSADMKTFGVKMFFSDKKMKVEAVTDDLTDAERSRWDIYNFKTGIHYKIFRDEKKFSIDSLDNFSSLDNNNAIALRDTSLHENILGNRCHSYVAIPDANEALRVNFLSLLWLADSIRFTIPERYRNKRGIQSLPDGNMIFLKMKVILSFDSDDDDQDDMMKRKTDSVFFIAEKIERVKLNDSEFLPPADYTFSKYERPINRDSVRISELTLTELKQEEDKPEPPPPPPPKTAKPLKAPAKKEKVTKSVKG